MITGTLINSALIIIGTFVGMLFKKLLPQRLRDTSTSAISFVVMFVGISGAVSAALTYEDGIFGVRNTLVMIVSVVLGSIVGELINIEKRLDRLGAKVQSKFAKGGNSTFAEGFVSATLIFCVGAMAVVGSLDNGIRGSIDVLLAKSTIDGFTSVVLASTLGIGVAFSALPVLFYQGAISLLAVYIEPFLTDAVISQMSYVGSVLIFAIGIKASGIAKPKVGNMLPAIFMPLVFLLFENIRSMIF